MKKFWNVIALVCLIVVIISAILSLRYFGFFYLTLFAFAGFVIASAKWR